MNQLKILLADDHPLLLRGLVSFLSEKGFGKVISAENGIKAWKLLQVHHPDICIFDIEMPGLTGLEILDLCKEDNIETKIILLSYHNEPEFIALARQKGVAGYIGKENTIREIEDCIYQVQKEGYYFPHDLRGNYVRSGQDIIQSLFKLTKREKEILSWIITGNTNKDIARKLDISQRTVEKHRDNIVSKLNIRGKDENLFMWAIENKTLLNDIFA